MDLAGREEEREGMRGSSGAMTVEWENTSRGVRGCEKENGWEWVEHGDKYKEKDRREIFGVFRYMKRSGLEGWETIVWVETSGSTANEKV